MGKATGQAKEKMRDYLAEIGRRGGLASRRELTRSQAKEMVAIVGKRNALPEKTESHGRRDIVSGLRYVRQTGDRRAGDLQFVNE